MKYTQSDQFQSALQSLTEVLELINYRPRTIDSYLQCIFECCRWLADQNSVSIEEADFRQLRAFLLYLKRDKMDGGCGYAPRSVNIYNCAIKKFFRFVLRKPLTNDELPLCKVDHPLPKVPNRKDTAVLIFSTKNLKHRLALALTYCCALRLQEVVSLRFRDLSFQDGFLTIPEDISKSRHSGRVELPPHLKPLMAEYCRNCCPKAGPDDWIFPGQKPGTHINKETFSRIFKNRIAELGWESRSYTFHSLRHAHALHYYQAGADLFQVQVRLRHRSIRSTLIYVQLDAKLREWKVVAHPFNRDDFPYEAASRYYLKHCV